MLPTCPGCGNRETVRRETLDWGTPVAVAKTYCVACGWTTGWVSPPDRASKGHVFAQDCV